MKSLFLITAIALLTITSCKKKSTTPDPTPAPTTTGSTTGTTPTIDINSGTQTTFMLDGTSLSYVADNTHFFSGSGSSGSVNYSYDSGIDDGDTTTFINITKGTINTGGGSP